MEIFLDSADLGEIKAASDMGLIDGITTNPSLVAKAGARLETLVPQICDIVDGPVSAEVISTDAAGMIQEGERLAAIHPNVVVKIPLIAAGMHAVKHLTSRGIRTNVTLCFQANQALLAAKAGATYVSPFVGRLDDISQEGMGLIDQILRVYRNYGFATKVLVASVRHPVHLLQSALLGAHVATIPYGVLLKLLEHPLTQHGLEKFLSDARQATTP